MQLATARLLLREIGTDDEAPLLAMFAEPEVQAHILTRQRDPANIRAFVARAQRAAARPQRASFHLAVASTAAPAHAIGLVSLTRARAGGVARIGWHFAGAAQRRGYATEAARAVLEFAFTDLGVRRVVADCFADNAAGRRMCQRLGMSQDVAGWIGTRRIALDWGEWRPMVRYAIGGGGEA